MSPYPTLRAVAAALCITAAGCSNDSGHGGGASVVLAQPPDSTLDFGRVAPFALTERNGTVVTREALAGRPWVAGFVFTRCTGPCPKITATMRKLQDLLTDVDARLVSFSVDPEWDTPEVLRAYADAVGADEKKWLFLTGEESEIHGLVQGSFLSAVQRAAPGDAKIGEHVAHRTQLVVVDKVGRLRGFYAGETPVDLAAIAARVRFLGAEETGGATQALESTDATPARR